MPSDYDAITSENAKRLGTDTQSRRTQVSMYSDPTHFIYELLQNADDYGATHIDFNLQRSKLVITHDGQPFTEENVRAITYFGKSTSRDNFLKTGRFGVGFKSVFAYTATPRVASADERFEIYGLYRIRAWTPPKGMGLNDTVIELPFNHDRERPDFVEDEEWVSPEKAFDRIGSRLSKSLEVTTLLFTQNLRQITWRAGSSSGQQIREDLAEKGLPTRVISTDGLKKKYLVFSQRIDYRGVEHKPIEVAFPLATDGSPGRESAPLYVLFPTAVPTGLGFIVNGPFLTNPARETVGFDKPFNQHLIHKAGDRAASALLELRDHGHLDTDFLGVLPNSMDELTTFFEPMRERLIEAFGAHELVPTDEKGRFATAVKTRTGPASLRRVIRPPDLEFLAEEPGVRWAMGVSPNSRPERLLNDAGVASWEWGDLSDRFGGDRYLPDPDDLPDAMKWLAAKEDKWLIRLYLEIAKAVDGGGCPSEIRSSLLMRGVTRGKMAHVLFSSVYFPRGGFAALPQVKKAWLGSSKKAKTLRSALEALGVSTIGDEQRVEKILETRYKIAEPEVEKDEHLRHMRTFIRAWEANELKARDVGRVPIFVTEDLGLCSAGACYIAQPLKATGLEILYDREDSPLRSRHKLSSWYRGLAGFVEFAEACGVSTCLTLKRTGVFWSHPEGHYLRSGGGRSNENTINRDYDLDRLGKLLYLRDPRISAMVWDLAGLAKARELKAEFRWNNSHSLRDAPASWIYTLRESEWLPGVDGILHRPADIELENLDPDFKVKLSMKRSGFLEAIELGRTAREQSAEVQARNEQARELGISPKLAAVFSSMSETEQDKYAEKLAAQQRDEQSGVSKGGPFHAEFAANFERSSSGHGTSPSGRGGRSANPARRRSKVQEGITAAKGLLGPQSSFRPLKRWTKKNNASKKSLEEWYGGKCQICSDTFSKRDGSPYFEAIYWVSYTSAPWVDRPGNLLCLCPTHSAMLQHGSVRGPEDPVRVIQELELEGERAGRKPQIVLQVCGTEATVTWVDKHLIDLQEMLRSSLDLEEPD